MNKLFEVHIYRHKAIDGCLGDFDDIIYAATDAEAFEKYHSVTDYEVKELMKYASMADDADGEILEADWKE